MLTADNISKRIDGLTEDDLTRKESFIPECFKGLRNMERLIDKLPNPERDRIKIVLAEELNRIETVISVEVSERLLSDEIESAYKAVERGDHRPLHAVMSKQLAMVTGE